MAPLWNRHERELVRVEKQKHGSTTSRRKTRRLPLASRISDRSLSSRGFLTILEFSALQVSQGEAGSERTEKVCFSPSLLVRVESCSFIRIIERGFSLRGVAVMNDLWGFCQ